MDASKRNQLERDAFAIRSADDSLELAHDEAALIEMRLALRVALPERRGEAGLTQARLVRLTGSSPLREAKGEAGDQSVSLDLQIRALQAISASRLEVERALGRRQA